ncbi:hypothetical protein AaE_014174 [Aphanomyces astaci]|uniref:Uncharacterized protein n=1 Tax=Aphanomyces astaci TaxID=112090 RepID=A0A6A4Z1B7_APHAT|nr:hypothetical protein AaE_014174 [Aphanomyces astaci]
MDEPPLLTTQAQRAPSPLVVCTVDECGCFLLKSHYMNHLASITHTRNGTKASTHPTKLNQALCTDIQTVTNEVAWHNNLSKPARLKAMKERKDGLLRRRTADQQSQESTTNSRLQALEAKATLHEAMLRDIIHSITLDGASDVDITNDHDGDNNEDTVDGRGDSETPSSPEAFMINRSRVEDTVDGRGGSQTPSSPEALMTKQSQKPKRKGIWVWNLYDAVQVCFEHLRVVLAKALPDAAMALILSGERRRRSRVKYNEV